MIKLMCKRAEIQNKNMKEYEMECHPRDINT